MGSLTPIRSVVFVSEDAVSEIDSTAISVHTVGEKAFGLAALPQQWTLSFFVVSASLLKQYAACPGIGHDALLKSWISRIREAAHIVGIAGADDVIVRSSAESEGLTESGRYHSVHGSYADLHGVLLKCLSKLANDDDVGESQIPLVIQKYATITSAKGHLSNERRCFKEARDWLVQFDEDATRRGASSSQINLRNWRHSIDVARAVNKPLSCTLSPHVSETLRIAAWWAYRLGVRLHMEWVWDGQKIFLVQAAEEHSHCGVDPTKQGSYQREGRADFTPCCLKPVGLEHAERYEKIRNVWTYRALDLPIAKLYILDDQEIIRGLALGEVPDGLRMDVTELVQQSLVIRVDISTKDLQKRQMLPRTPEERDAESAIGWLIETARSVNVIAAGDNIAFIFHGFIPAVSSAFAYAIPGQRIVRIESIWGLPEGLYYNAHDKYVVDTASRDSADMKTEKFEIRTTPHFKRYFVTPDDSGQWTSSILSPPYDWRLSIGRKEWIKQIALDSRRIADHVQQPVSIMWFVNVDKSVCESRVFPWYHEHFSLISPPRQSSSRPKTMYDRTLVIRTNAELDELRSESQLQASNIKCIRIQPTEDSLIRNKNALRQIGELAKQLGAVIYMEGGVLSHAYYQLIQTGAIVEVVHPFSNTEDKREFNKLVRDRIPDNIRNGGEQVSTTTLNGESLLRAMREKLVEECIEALDAMDQQAIMAELADVNEIVDAILQQIGTSRLELENIQNNKRARAGGFSDGVVLLDTIHALPPETSRLDPVLFEHEDYKAEPSPADALSLIERRSKIDRWNDHREHRNATETILSLSVPVIRDDWVAHSAGAGNDSSRQRDVRLRVTGSRQGSRLKLEISVFSDATKQLTLFDLSAEGL